MTPTGTPPAAITPQGIRDGDPAVLAALVARRGPAVMAFATEICDESYAVRATADAFARFRAAVASDEDAIKQHPDALLLRCARRAALDLAPRGPDLGCRPATELLALRAEKAIKPRDTTLLNRHLADCEHCRDLAAGLEAADRAYREAEDEVLEPITVAPIVAALAAAAPVHLDATNGTAQPAAAGTAKKAAKVEASADAEAEVSAEAAARSAGGTGTETAAKSVAGTGAEAAETAPDAEATPETAPDAQTTAKPAPDAQTTAKPAPDAQTTAEPAPDAQTTAKTAPD